MDNHNGDRMDVFTVVERAGRSFWVKVGSAFVNGDASVNVFLDAVPLNGKLQVRPAKENDRDDGRRDPPERSRDSGRDRGRR